MQPNVFDHAYARATVMVALLGGLSGCAATGDNPFTVFADPGKYEYYDCAQLSAQRKQLTSRELELRQLMDRAEQSAGGTVASLLAYKADHVAASEDLKLLENAARAKSCETPATWRSNSVVR
jgi:hypothetical protein